MLVLLSLFKSAKFNWVSDGSKKPIIIFTIATTSSILIALSKLALDESSDNEFFRLNQHAIENRQTSELIHNTEVKTRVVNVQSQDFKRKNDFIKLLI